MTHVIPTDCTLELVSETSVGQYRFHPDGHVAATIGTRDGPVCAPMLAYEVLGDSSIALREGGRPFDLWTEIRRVEDVLHVRCRGSRLTFRILP